MWIGALACTMGRGRRVANPARQRNRSQNPEQINTLCRSTSNQIIICDLILFVVLEYALLFYICPSSWICRSNEMLSLGREAIWSERKETQICSTGRLSGATSLVSNQSSFENDVLYQRYRLKLRLYLYFFFFAFRVLRYVLAVSFRLGCDWWMRWRMNWELRAQRLSCMIKCQTNKDKIKSLIRSVRSGERSTVWQLFPLHSLQLAFADTKVRTSEI